MPNSLLSAHTYRMVPIAAFMEDQRPFGLVSNTGSSSTCEAEDSPL